MDILFTLNKKYKDLLLTCLLSIAEHHQTTNITFHIVSNDISDADISYIKKYIPSQYEFKYYNYRNEFLDTAKTTYRYPQEIYYRLFVQCYLKQEIKRILYLDVDTIVIKNLKNFYEQPFEDSFFIGATNIKKALTTFNNVKNKAKLDSHYLNTGVLLINVEDLRKKQSIDELNQYILKNEKRLFLPDQDVLNALYGHNVKLVNHLKYNLSDRAITKYNLMKLVSKIDLDWVNENAYIIHYYGKNKPWLPDYKGILKDYYLKYDQLLKSIQIREQI